MKKLIMAVVAAPLALGLVASPAVAEEPQPVLPGAVHADGVWTYEDGHTETHTADLGVITAPVGDTITSPAPTGSRCRTRSPTTSASGSPGCRRPSRICTSGCGRSSSSQVADDGTTIRVVRAGFPLVRRDQPGCGLFEGAVHGDVTLTYVDGTTRSFSFDRGEIESVTDGEILMQRPDGVAVTTSPTTRPGSSGRTPWTISRTVRRW